MRWFGIGPGVLILAVLWFLAAVGSVVLGRGKGTGAVIGIFVLTTVISVILLTWPLESIDGGPEPEEIIVDILSIPRIVFVVILVIFAIVALRKYLELEIFTPIYAQSVAGRQKTLNWNRRL